MGHTRGSFYGLVHLAKDAPYLIQKNRACGGQLDAPLGTKEELKSEFLFELLNLPAQRRLSQMQPRGSPAEMEFFGNGYKGT